MTTVRAFAPAKINLTLHVTGQRADGFHLLDSLVVFADIGDRIVATKAAETVLDVTGPMARGLAADGDNLVLRAAKLMDVTAHITLEKNLPIAAGMGGGSSDAAATMRALAQMSGGAIPGDLGAQLGADVPVCLRAKAARMTGIGGEVEPVLGLPALFAVLVNPRVGVPTPDVFKRLTEKNNPPMSKDLPKGGSASDFACWLGEQRNDLERAAISVQPVIADVLEALRVLKAPLLVRMSGSGASCFALFETYDRAVENAATLRQQHDDWWVEAARLN